MYVYSGGGGEGLQEGALVHMGIRRAHKESI